MPFKLKLPYRHGKEGPKKQGIKDEWQRLCEDPKYYQHLQKGEIPEIQQGLYHDLMRLPFEKVLDQGKTINELLKDAEEKKKQGKFSEAAELYRQAATLGLLKPEIRIKIDPKATDVKTEDVIAYLKLATELGYPISYDTIIKYIGIAREIASEILKTYQPKIAEKKKETGEIAGELVRK